MRWGDWLLINRKKTVAEVVDEASRKMSDANYSAVMVGGFVQTQDAAAKYISAHETELGGAEGVVNAIFHAALIALCFQRANNQTVRRISFEDMNHVAGSDREKRLEDTQPAVLGYITANVEDAEMKQVLMLMALALEWAS